MKLNRKKIVMFLALAVILAGNAICQAESEYILTDLGTLPGDYLSRAYSINNSGQVVGVSERFGRHQAFLYSGGTMTNLNSLDWNSYAYAINDFGQIAGYFTTFSGSNARAFLYSGGMMTNLGTFGGPNSIAYGINNAGQVAGISDSISGNRHAFLYGGGTIIDLNVYNTSINPSSSAYGINNLGQVVGRLEHAYLFNGEAMVDLGTLGGVQSTARAINDLGQVVGSSQLTIIYPNNYKTHAFLYSGGTMTDLGTLGGSDSSALAINNLGQVVGYFSGDTAHYYLYQSDYGPSQVFTVANAFLYDEGVIKDLNNLIDPSLGWALTTASAINDNGQIVGCGTINNSLHAFLLTPRNRSPRITSIGNKSIAEGQNLQFTISATDPDGDTLMYEAGNLPTGATFDPTARTFTWTPTYSQAGAYQNVLFKVTDNGTPIRSASEFITITVGNVNRPPVLNSIGNKAAKEGELLQFNISATDPDGDFLIFSGSNLPSGASFDPSSRTFSWTPAIGQAGSYQSVLFTVTDGNLNASEMITITVESVNRPPILNPIGSRMANEGETLEFVVTATDPDGNALTYDASSLPIGAAFDPAQQKFSWTPNYDQAGNYQVVFSVQDDGNPVEVATEIVTVTVGNVDRAPVFYPAGSQIGIEGQLLQFNVFATDPDGDSITYSASNLPLGASFDPSARLFSWVPNYGLAGAYPVTFVASDGTLTGETLVVITINQPSPSELSTAIVNQVLSLDLPNSVENSYIANIKKLNDFIAKGQKTAAINQIDAFIGKVSLDISNGIISSEDGNLLITMALELRAMLLP